MKTKDKLLFTAADLFNRYGVNPVTTNHIAKAMEISPGNLYFHYRNKEEILAQLFRIMCQETYKIWRPRRSSKSSISDFIDENFELYWRFRFFHREMYALRRKDPALAGLWRKHIQKMMRLMKILYRHWHKSGLMIPISDTEELTYLSESILAMSTTFLQYFESAEKASAKKSIDRGRRHVARLLLPYTSNQAKTHLESILKDN